MKPILIVGHAQSLTVASWWLDVPAEHFTERARQEHDRMLRSKFAHLIVLAQGPSLPSSHEAAMTRKRAQAAYRAVV